MMGHDAVRFVTRTSTHCVCELRMKRSKVSGRQTEETVKVIPVMGDSENCKKSATSSLFFKDGQDEEWREVLMRSVYERRCSD